MTQHSERPDYNQYGMKSKDATVSDVYGNRPGGEEPGVGPAEAVDSSGHRIGVTEHQDDPKPSSRLGRDVIGEVDDKKGPSGAPV